MHLNNNKNKTYYELELFKWWAMIFFKLKNRNWLLIHPTRIWKAMYSYWEKYVTMALNWFCKIKMPLSNSQKQVREKLNSLVIVGFSNESPS